MRWFDAAAVGDRALLEPPHARAWSCACRGSRAPVPADRARRPARSSSRRPDSRPRKFSAVRSAVSSARARALDAQHRRRPRATRPRAPSRVEPHVRVERAEHRLGDVEPGDHAPGAFCVIAREPRVPGGDGRGGGDVARRRRPRRARGRRSRPGPWSGTLWDGAAPRGRPRSCGSDRGCPSRCGRAPGRSRRRRCRRRRTGSCRSPGRRGSGRARSRRRGCRCRHRR